MANLQDALPELFLSLANDVIIAERELDQAEPQFRRRSYVRAVFALVEGVTFVMKQFALSVHERGDITLPPAEVAPLREEQYDLDKGTPRTKQKFLKVADNLRFAFKTFAQAFRSTYTLDTTVHQWQLFSEAIDLRNRITHPKAPDDLIISDDEMRKIQEVAAWYRKVTGDLFRSRGTRGGAT